MIKIQTSIFTFFLLTQAYAQNDQVPIASSPQALDLAGGNTSSLYNGSRVEILPLASITNRETYDKLSVVYNGGGIQVDQLPGALGLGWSLSVGGAITREVRGADDFGDGFLTSDEPMIHGNDISGECFVGGRDVKNTLSRMASGVWDAEPDIFQYSFPGASGRFIFDFSDGQVKTLPEVPLQINPPAFSDPSGEWIIRSPGGFTFYFGGTNATEKTSGTIAGELVSTWYLTKIVGPGASEITYTYSEPSPVPQIEQVNKVRVSSRINCNHPQYLPREYEYRTNLTIKVRNLTRIDYGVETIEFRYKKFDDTFSHPSIKGTSFLDQIEVKSKQNALTRSRYVFDYISDPDSSRYHLGVENGAQRIWLAGFEEEITGEKHKFWYYDEQSLPDYGSLEQDFWGFYNGKNGTLDASDFNSHVPTEFFPNTRFCNDCPGPGMSCYPLDVNTAGNKDVSSDLYYAKMGTLRLARYPAGGFRSFEYGLHQFEVPDYYGYGGSPYNDTGAGLRIKKVRTFRFFGDPNLTTTVYNFSGGLTTTPKLFTRIQLAGEFDQVIQSSNNKIFLTPVKGGGYVGYDRVSISVNGVLSESINFTNAPVLLNFSVGTGIMFPGYPALPTVTYSHINGYITQRTKYSNNVLLSKEIRKYSIQNALNIKASRGYGSDTNPSDNDCGYKIADYYLKASYRQLDTLIQIDYSGARDSIFSIYEYGNPSHKQATTITTFNTKNASEVFVSEIKYPQDITGAAFAVQAIYNSMADAGSYQIATPVEQLNSKIIGGEKYAISGTFDLYEELTDPARNVFKIKETYDLLLAEPYRITGPFHLYSTFQSSPHVQKTQANEYGDHHLLEESATNNGSVRQVLTWEEDAFNNPHMVAKTEYVERDQVFHTSFEYNTSAAPGQAYTGNYAYNGVYNVPGNSLKAGTYTLTFFQRVSGSWQPVSQRITHNGSSNIPVGQAGVLVDEIRIAPKSASITTYTYDVFGNVLTKTDANHRRLIHEYDSAGRLIKTIDHEGNVVRQLDYGVKTF